MRRFCERIPRGLSNLIFSEQPKRILTQNAEYIRFPLYENKFGIMLLENNTNTHWLQSNLFIVFFVSKMLLFFGVEMETTLN